MAGSNLSPFGLKLFHKVERDFYGRLVQQLRQDRERMKLVMALWLWFESIGHHDFISRVSSVHDANVVLGFVAEAEACLGRLLVGDGGRGGDGDDGIPLTASLMAPEEMGLRFFDYHRQHAVKGIHHFFHNVCQVILDDVGGGGGGASAVQGAPSSPAPPLNPMAKPWSPDQANQTAEDQRSMFITFSRGHPISREDIVEFFSANYGPCLETVMIEKAQAGQLPMYGRLVFRSASMIAMVLNGQQTAKLLIKGKHLWARMYIPRHPVP
ncbi:uncharacterized protein LOC121995150 [Zingiber officinale]|uniref:Uncharacterized protein n=1 Tax=Zingiber officinale TaxID=94328 RepID=A0A8J5G6P6_ZINOF|nr:uncharacterized protein LOC121995150 [Zingiber officinale]KAG6500896.1 hypothetical protein ZIOFF_040757 [Zingiber officinale]